MLTRRNLLEAAGAGVALGGSVLALPQMFAARAAGAELTRVCRTLEQAGGGWADGYVCEYCARLPVWARAVTGGLERGLALWIDYGLPRRQYYLPERRDGTLLCHFRQRAHDESAYQPKPAVSRTCVLERVPPATSAYQGALARASTTAVRTFFSCAA